MRSNTCATTGPSSGTRAGVAVAGEGVHDVADGRDQHPGRGPVQRAARVRGDRQRLDLPVEGGVVVPEVLEVGEVARARPVVERDHQPRPVRGVRPTRDDAWMYSAVFFGWPTTTISPKRGTSTPTWSIEVASTTSTASVSRLRSRDRSIACGGRRLAGESLSRARPSSRRRSPSGVPRCRSRGRSRSRAASASR